MELPLIPLDIWRLIWKNISVGVKGRLELVCSSLHRSIWTSTPIWEYHGRTQNRLSLRRYLSIFTAKPALIARLGKFHSSSPFPISPSIACFANATSLTNFFIHEPKSGGVFNLLSTVGCPLRNLTIISTSSTAYSSLNLKGLERLKPTLRRLSLLIDRRYSDIMEYLPGTRELLVAIASTLGDSLLTLSVFAKDWSPLKGMTALKELFVSQTKNPFHLFDVANLDTTTAHLRSLNPPGIGVNLVICLREHPVSLLSQAAELSSDKVTECIEIYGADPSLAPYAHFLTSSRTSLVVTAIERERFAVAKALIEGGASVYVKGRRSPFMSILVKWVGAEDRWTEFASYLFDDLWPRMVTKHTPTELLGFPPEMVLFKFLEAAPSTAVIHRTRFVLARPNVFGKVSVHDLNHKGCNLFHKCAVNDDIAVLETLKVDWRVKDNAGLDAIECIAARRMDLTPRLLARLCKSDQDFLDHATPLVWGMVNSDLMYIAAQDSSFLTMVKRMQTLVPRDRWLDLITATVQVQFRCNRMEIIRGYLELNDPVLTDLVWKAVFRPWREVRELSWYRQLSLTRRERQPLPHVIDTEDVAKLVGEQLRVHFPDKAKAEEWAKEKNKRGRTAREFLISEFDSPELGTRLALLKFYE